MLAQTAPQEGKVLPSLLQDNFVPTSTVLVRKPLLEEVGGFGEHPDLHGVEDYHLWLRLAMRETCFSFVPKALVQYRNLPRSQGDVGMEEALDRLLTMFAHLPAMPERYEELVRWRKFTTTVALARSASPLSRKVALCWQAVVFCPYRKLLQQLTHRAHA